MNKKLFERYYAKRASEYDEIYAKPERQPDIKSLKQFLKKSLSGLNILDLGCGTGYWTMVLSETASVIDGIDINESVLEVAAGKKYKCPVTFNKGSYFQLKDKGQQYEGVFGGFIFSHIPKEKLTPFMEGVSKVVKPGGVMVFVDNIYVEGSNTPLSRKDEEGNTYQTRTLNNGETFEVLKNFPEEEELKALLNGAGEMEYQELDYYWILGWKISDSDQRI